MAHQDIRLNEISLVVVFLLWYKHENLIMSASQIHGSIISVFS